MRRKVSGLDVAREAGVSQSTVSLVLNNKSEAGIPEETRQRVLEAARRLRYSSNAAARSLITGRTNRIGVLADHPDQFLSVGGGTYYGSILAGILRGVRVANRNLLFHSAAHQDWHSLFADITNGSTDGVLLVGRPFDDPIALALLDAHFPTVFISSRPHRDTCFAVDCDNEEGGYLAMKHLLALGHRRILFVITPDAASWLTERRSGMQRAIAEFDATDAIVTSVLIGGPYAWTLLHEAAHHWHNHPAKPTAILLNDEYSSFYFMEEAIRAGLRIPEDLSVVGFNATVATPHGLPQLTAIDQPLVEIGAASVAVLHQHLEDESVPYGVKRLPVRLKLGASCGVSLL